MLEYIKMILLKVSFDNMLFEKELRKGLKALEREERQQEKAMPAIHFYLLP